MAKNIKAQLKLQIQAAKANPAPPVGPALGQHGINIQEFCMRFNEATKDIPVIVLTNLESTGDIERALELGATTYLVKVNYTLQEVIQKIKQALGE